MSYSISVENGAENYAELEPLYREHYAEMQARLAEDGIEMPDYNLRLDEYVRAWNTHLLNFVVRFDGAAVGYCNVYLTNDMHNNDLIAQEDTIFITKAHRKGIGRKLAKAVIEVLRLRGAKRFHIVAATDPRATKLWERIGFKPAGQAMIYRF